MPELIEISGFGKQARRSVKRKRKPLARRKTKYKRGPVLRGAGSVGLFKRPLPGSKTELMLQKLAKAPTKAQLKKYTIKKNIKLDEEVARLKKAVNHLSKGEWEKAANTAYYAGIRAGVIAFTMPSRDKWCKVATKVVVASRNVILYAVKRVKKSKV